MSDFGQKSERSLRTFKKSKFIFLNTCFDMRRRLYSALVEKRRTRWI